MKFFLFIIFFILTSSIYSQNNQETIFPDNCEGNSYRLDALRTEAIESYGTGSSVIVVARLGDGESDSQLNKRRLYTVKKYLGASVTNLVLTHGESVKGYGRIEVYIQGLLKAVLAVKKCQGLSVGSCDDSVNDFKKYQLPKPKRKIKCL